MGEPNKPGSAGATLFGVADPKIHSSTYVLLRRIWSMHIPQNWGAGPHHMTLKSTRLPNMCYHTHFDHSRSNCVGRVSKIFGCTGATPPFGWVRGWSPYKTPFHMCYDAEFDLSASNSVGI